MFALAVTAGLVAVSPRDPLSRHRTCGGHAAVKGRRALGVCRAAPETRCGRCTAVRPPWWHCGEARAEAHGRRREGEAGKHVDVNLTGRGASFARWRQEGGCLGLGGFVGRRDVFSFLSDAKPRHAHGQQEAQAARKRGERGSRGGEAARARAAGGGGSGESRPREGRSRGSRAGSTSTGTCRPPRSGTSFRCSHGWAAHRPTRRRRFRQGQRRSTRSTRSIAPGATLAPGNEEDEEVKN